MMNDSFSTFDLTHARRDLSSIYRKVADEHARVEIRRAGSDQSCVVISKTELESLERALEVLSNARAVRSLSASLAQVAAAAQGAYDGR
jgi:PHD/YefM family antitoxin component YafN of YafNO toxin-antitoxin module